MNLHNTTGTDSTGSPIPRIHAGALSSNGRTTKRKQPAFSTEWAAGFADGEACIHVAKQTYKCGRNDTYRLRVYITQNDLSVLEHFKNGLCIHAGIFAVKRTQQHNRQCYTLNYDGRHAMDLIKKLAPHLVRKRQEAAAAKAFWTQGQVGLRCGAKGLPPALTAIRERQYRKLQRLK